MRSRGRLDSPVFAPLAPVLARCPGERFPSIDELNRLLPAGAISGGGAMLRFVPASQPSRDFDAQYEVRAFRRGEVQTRPGDWHDLFNALVWITFPRTKAVINRHHFEQMLARRGERLRGTARDVLTLFDEGGIIVASADPALSELLRDFRWKELFWERRTRVLRDMRFYVFGHAIYEKALEPYPGVTAKALIVGIDRDFLSRPIERQLEFVDVRASEYFGDPRSLTSTRTLSPLPILGIPGWHPANEREECYDDETQFRPGRGARATRAD